MEYATDTALDHMTVMDENESPVEVHITKSRHFHFKGLPTYYIENGTGDVMNCREPALAA
jgi:hypothetical protein